MDAKSIISNMNKKSINKILKKLNIGYNSNVEPINKVIEKIKYYDIPNNTKILSREYFCNDKCHRLDGPANILYYENGDVNIAEYFIEGYLHRDYTVGPAIIVYDTNGIPVSWEYWNRGIVHDIKIEDDKFYKQVNIQRNLKLLNKE